MRSVPQLPETRNANEAPDLSISEKANVYLVRDGA